MGAYLAFKAAAAKVALDDLSHTAAMLKTGEAITDSATLESSTKRLADDVATLDTVSHDPLVAAIWSLPWLRNDLGAVAETSSAVHQVFDDALPAVVALSEANSTGNLLGKLSPQAARVIETQLTKLNTSLGVADRVLGRWQSAKLDFGLSPKLTQLHAQLAKAQTSLHRVTPLIALAAPLATGSNTWFVANENLAEARGTGGILGSWAIIKVENGKVSLVASGSDQDLDKIGKVNFRALPTELRSAWGVTPDNWRDLNAPRSFEYFATQIRDSIARKYKIDGVISIGQGTVARMVAATGPITVDGVEITGSNAHDFLGKGIYAKFTDVTKKNQFIQKLLLKIFAKVSQAKLDLKGLWSNLLVQDSADQVYGWAQNKKLEDLFLLGEVGGLVNPTFGSQVYFTLNNAGANKLDAYTHLTAKYALGKCSQMTDNGFRGRQASFEATLANLAPKGLPDYVSPRHPTYFGVPIKLSTNRTLYSVYAPVGSTRQNFTLDGEPIFASEVLEKGHPVWTFDISLTPGKSRKLVLNWIEPVENADGKNIQTRPTIVVPSAFNPIEADTSSSGFCSVK